MTFLPLNFVQVHEIIHHVKFHPYIRIFRGSFLVCVEYFSFYNIRLVQLCLENQLASLILNYIFSYAIAIDMLFTNMIVLL